jgi:glycogen operon protein
VGPNGFRLGGFPPEFAEWNARFRDAVRGFWRGDAGVLPELGRRLTGSSDVFAWNGRGATASINYVCSHDGMTLADLVAYAHKHNEANGEGNRDGPDDLSRNWGAEGPSRQPRVQRMRERVRRSLAATLAVSHGVPMWLAGDEISRTQRGNNNAYCHDDETSWLDWRPEPARARFLAFVQRALAVRRGNAVFRRRASLDGAPDAVVAWLRPDGQPMQPADWHAEGARAVALRLDAAAADPEDEAGSGQAARTALLLLNGDANARSFRLPDPGAGASWRAVLDSACDTGARRLRGDQVRVAAYSLLVLEREAAT